MTSCFLLRSCSTSISTGTDFYQYFMLPCHWWPWRVHWAHDSQSHLALCIWSKCNPALPKKISLPPFEILWVHARSWCKLATWSSFHIMYVDYMPTWLTQNGWHFTDDIVRYIPWIIFFISNSWQKVSINSHNGWVTGNKLLPEPMTTKPTISSIMSFGVWDINKPVVSCTPKSSWSLPCLIAT